MKIENEELGRQGEKERFLFDLSALQKGEEILHLITSG